MYTKAIRARAARRYQATCGVPTTARTPASRPPPRGMIQRRGWLRLCGRARVLSIVMSFPILRKSKPDDERRDLETHLKEHFRLSLAMQVKATHVLYQHGRVRRLQKRFFVKRQRLIEDPFFFYFFGFMDLETMASRAPVFLVPSHVVHTQAEHQVRGNIVDFNFVASIDPLANDRFHKYGCDPADLASRLLTFLPSQPRPLLLSLLPPAPTIITP